MSKLQELIKLISKGLSNPKEVAEGWINSVKLELGSLPQDEVEEIARRRFICSECPFHSEKAKSLVGYKTDRKDAHCTLCSCPLKAKTASLSSVCGAQYYNNTHPEKTPLPVRWEEYKK